MEFAKKKAKKFDKKALFLLSFQQKTSEFKTFRQILARKSRLFHKLMKYVTFVTCFVTFVSLIFHNFFLLF